MMSVQRTKQQKEEKGKRTTMGKRIATFKEVGVRSGVSQLKATP